MPGVLVIDDDPSIALLIRQAVVDLQIPVFAAGTAREGYEAATRERPEVLVLDVMLPDQPGLDLFGKLRELDGKVPVIVVTASGGSRTAITAMRLGAYDFLVKPLELSDVRQRIQRAAEICRLTRMPLEVRTSSTPSAGEAEVLVGRSVRMQQVYKTIGRIADRGVAVLVRGESGTGKERVARVIHQNSTCAAGAFVTLQCAKTADVEAELLGEQRPGAARGDRGRAAHLRRSSGGTLFLDEVAELSLPLQSSLLELLLDQTCARNGDPTATSAEVRVIAATSHNLPQLLAAGEFRADLFYQLSCTTIDMPPLRERLEDLPALADHFLSRQMPLLKKRVYRLAPETLEALRRYAWPGNVRELESVLREALLRTTGSVLLPEFLPHTVLAAKAEATVAAPASASTNWEAFVRSRLEAGSENIYSEAEALMQRELLTLLLRHTGGHQAQAARLLGITRGSLRSKLRALGIVIDRRVDVHANDDASEADDA